MANSLALADALTLIAAVQSSATARGLKVTTCVVDFRGREIASQRMDGSMWFTPGIARVKAQTAAHMEMDSEAFGALAARNAGILEPIGSQLPFTPTVLKGGVVIKVDDVVVGGIGVSGASSDEDVELALAAIEVWSK